MTPAQRPPRSSAARLAALCFALAGCVTSEGSGEYFTDWDRAGGCLSGDDRPWGVSLAGKPLGPCEFRGRFVWVTYDALWCAPCRMQAVATAEAARRGSAHTVFMSVLTGGSTPFAPATEAEMRRWAERLELDAERVVSEGATSRTVPQHALIGPDGRTWLRYVGPMSAQAILDTIDAFRRGKRTPPET